LREDVQTLAAAVVGTGFIGLVHVEALRRLGIEVTGVVGSSPRRSTEKAEQHGLPRGYESLDAMLADDRVDVVHIASPNDAHFDQVRTCLAAGKHVICEKPLAISSHQTRELVRLAESTGLVNAVNFNIRFYPHVLEVHERVRAGDLGPVRLVTGSYLQDWLLLETDWNWRVERRRGGPQRAVSDIGSHWIDLLSFILERRPETLVADVHTFLPVRYRPDGPVAAFEQAAADAAVPSTEVEVDTDDAASVLLRWPGGVRGSFTVSQVSPGRKNALSFEIDGARSAACWRSERPDELWLGHRDRPNEILLRDPTLLSGGAASAVTIPAGHAEGFENTFKQLFARVYEDVAIGAPTDCPAYPTFLDGHRCAIVMEAIAASAAEHRWVEIESEPQGAYL
jgi:predicted dehydrogenase